MGTPDIPYPAFANIRWTAEEASQDGGDWPPCAHPGLRPGDARMFQWALAGLGDALRNRNVAEARCYMRAVEHLAP